MAGRLVLLGREAHLRTQPPGTPPPGTQSTPTPVTLTPSVADANNNVEHEQPAAIELLA